MSARRLALAAVPLLLGACDWFTDFKDQPRIDPWETATDTTPSRGNPQGSVPITGTAVAAFQVSYAALPATIDSMAGLANPTPMSATSLTRGRQYYQINCAVCHGDSGDGAGAATRYGMVPISLLTPVTLGRTDGYIYGMIRNGRGLMPSYNRIEEADRWDVVNYVRALQGRGGGATAAGGVGRPGETGALVPGATALGPTRPAPWFNPHARPAADTGPGPIPIDTTGALRVDTARARPPAGAPGDTAPRRPAPNGARASTNPARP